MKLFNFIFNSFLPPSPTSDTYNDELECWLLYYQGVKIKVIV